MKRLGVNTDSVKQALQDQSRVLEIIKKQDEQKKEILQQQEDNLKQQETNLKQQKENQALYTAIYIISVILLLIIMTVLFLTSRARKKQRNELEKRKNEIEEQHKLLEESKQITDQKNEQLRNNRTVLEQKNKEITDKNNQITDSIRYAQTIQNAVLPSLEELSSYLKDYFLLYMPKDIVSGDFYWTTRTENKTVLIVADSTGHGVPGAFLSMVGVDLFNDIVVAQQISDPAQILTNLHWGLFKRLSQEQEENKDGMDVCVCTIEKASSLEIKVTFAGAKRPLFYTHKGKLERLQGDRTYIGGVKKKEIIFNNQELFLEENDILYLSTDGYVDTPNPKKKKFGTGQFIKLLEEIKDLDIKEQGRILEDRLHEYRDNTPIRDDTTLLGVQLG